MTRLSSAGAVFVALAAALASAAEHRMARYNVVWDSPSKDAAGQMPLGNGDIAAGVYAIEDGDLYLLLAKNDAYTYNGDIFKTGRVRIALDPNPFARGKPFRQTLDLPTGSIRIEADGVSLRVWADAIRLVYHVQVESPTPVSVTAEPEFWKRIDSCKNNTSRAPIKNVTQDVRLERNGRILWYYAVGDRSVFPTEMQYYGVPEMVGKFTDPYRHNTFGNLLDSPDLALKDGKLVGSGKSFDIRIHAMCEQTPKPSTWVATIEARAALPVDVGKAWQEHCAWWAAFWDRSWIIASDNTLPPEEREKFHGDTPSGRRPELDGGALTAQSYNVFRFLMACQSRGQVQVKFNGGLFTQPLRRGGKFTHEDERDWGRRFTYQNQRLLYWPLLMSGDRDLIMPFFNYYWRLLPIRKAITKAWFGHEGAYYRENIEPTGGERDCGRSGKPPKTRPGENKGKGYYHSYYFTSGLETLAMMIEHVRYTGDKDCRDGGLVPFAREVLLFFDKHYPRDAEGKLRIDPGMVLETWWIAVNPAPDVAGLQFCLDELLAMKAGSARDQAEWKRFRAELPPIHLHKPGGKPAIAPALSWELKRNAENGELYPVFPFHCFGLAHGTEAIVAHTMKHRVHKNSFGYRCWTQDQIHWAYAGNAQEARDGLVRRFQAASTACRFPLYGRAGPDSCPDFDHFGAGATALQRMLVQELRGKILLLPAWPADWDVDFKLHVAGPAVLTGTVKDGKLQAWDIQPAGRRKDVVVGKPQVAPPSPLVPPNAHPLRAGSDQANQNHFRGAIGRVTMFRGRLDAARVRALAEGDRTQRVAGKEVVGCWLSPRSGDALATKAEDFVGPVSFEMWIQPAEGESGRIIDKLTPGQRDGFLLDTYPQLCLRLIVGPRQDDYPNVLRAGRWQHVALVIDRGFARVYLDGRSARSRDAR